MEIFDAHTHFFGRDFYEFQTTRSREGTPEILLKRLKAAGVEVPDRDTAAHALDLAHEQGLVVFVH